MKAHAVLIVASLFVTGCPSAEESAIEQDQEPLVVYCAHDAVFSQAILDEFERQTGIPVAVRMDTEATKSLGLVNLIIREKDAPRCDVFWNNEALGTMDLADRGLLEPYKGPGYERIPTQYKDPEGQWCGFAARLRVWIVNTNELEATNEAINAAYEDRLDDFTYAKPLFGTTLTHYCVFGAENGLDELKALDARFQEIATTAASNGQTRDLVANGTCAFGWTDTDDYFGAVDAGKPVGMVPVRVDAGTICIPNTVGIVKGTPRREAAEQLVDFLLSRETELRLARSESRQIPLGEIGDAELPTQVKDLIPAAAEGIDLRPASVVRSEVLEYLISTYAN